jgi:hypothetical protein
VCAGHRRVGPGCKKGERALAISRTVIEQERTNLSFKQIQLEREEPFLGHSTASRSPIASLSRRWRSPTATGLTIYIYMCYSISEEACRTPGFYERASPPAPPPFFSAARARARSSRSSPCHWTTPIVVGVEKKETCDSCVRSWPTR